MKDYFLVVNPTAAGGRVGKIWNDKIVPKIDSKLDYDFEFTTRVGHALELAQQKTNEGYKVICAVGGDGTANEVINGVLKAEKRSTFSAFTVGTGNDIPTVFGIPEGDIDAIIKSLIDGQDKKFDVGFCVNAGRYFAGVASMGFDAEVADRSNRGTKRFSGTINYQRAVFTTLLKFKPYDIIIEPNTGPIVTGQRMLVAIGNGKRYGGGMHICPDADPHDNLFHGITLKKISRFTLIRLLSLVYDGKHLTHPAVELFEGNIIKVDSPKKKCLYQVDGEILGYLPETFVTKPNFLTVRVPDPWISYASIWEKRLNEKKK